MHKAKLLSYIDILQNKLESYSAQIFNNTQNSTDHNKLCLQAIYQNKQEARLILEKQVSFKYQTSFPGALDKVVA